MDKTTFFYDGSDLEALSFAPNYYKWIFSLISPYLGKKIAEIGAGNGNFSELLVKSNFQDLFLFEPSSTMFKLLEGKFRNKNKVVLINNFIENCFSIFQNYFDSVCYINVLEHIENDSLAIQTAFKILRYGGNLVVFVPALKFLYSDFDKKVGHYRRYSREQLKNLILKNGFKILKLKYFDFLGMIAWYFKFVLLRGVPDSRSVALYDRYLVPLISKIENYLDIPVGKNLIVIARKV